MCVCACQTTPSEIKAVMAGGKQSFDRPSDRDTERQTSKQTAKPTGRHKGRLGEVLSDSLGEKWVTLVHCGIHVLDCQREGPLETQVTWQTTRVKWGKRPCVWQFHYPRHLMLMFNINPCDLNVKKCLARVEMCAPFTICVSVAPSLPGVRRQFPQCLPSRRH